MRTRTLSEQLFGKGIIYVLMFFLINPDGLGFIYSDIVSFFVSLCCALCCTRYIYLYFKRGRYSFYIIVAAIFSIWVNALNLVRSGNIVAAGYGMLLAIGKCCFFDYEIKRDSRQFCKHLFIYCFALVLINLVGVFFFPQGIYDAGRWGNFQILGNHNGYIVIILPGICAGYYALEQRVIKRRHYILYWVAVIATYCMERSLTSIISLVIIFGFILFLNSRVLQAFLNGPMYILLAAVINYLVVFRTRKSNLWFAMLALFRKNDTISGRTLIWDRAISAMSQSGWKLFGLPNNDLQNWLDLESVSLHHVHNLVLEVSFQAGVIGLVVFGALLCLTAYNLCKTYYDKSSRMLGCSFFALLVMLVTDFYGYPTILSILVMINALCGVIRRENTICSANSAQIRSMDIDGFRSIRTDAAYR